MARTVEKVSRPLIRQLDQRQFCVFTSRFGLIIRKAPLTCRVPDLAVFEESTIVEEDGFVCSAPQLAAEVLSPDERIEEKLADYASLGVPEVWVISPEARTVEVLHLENGHLRSAGVLADATLTPRLFPHVTFEIASIWRD
jgi:Uma2 family endonuclease